MARRKLLIFLFLTIFNVFSATTTSSILSPVIKKEDEDESPNKFGHETATETAQTFISTTTQPQETKSMPSWAYLCLKPIGQMNHEMSLVTKHLEGIRSVLVKFDKVIQEDVRSTFEEVQSLHTALREVETDVVSTSETLDRLVDWTSAVDKRMAALEAAVQRALQSNNDQKASCFPRSKKKPKPKKRHLMRMTDVEVMGDAKKDRQRSCVRELRSELNEFKKHVSSELSRRPSSCADILRSEGTRRSGVFTVNPRLAGYDSFVNVFCDMQTDGGGWTVIQRRNDYETEPKQDFNRSWADYRKGFGSVDNEFWLGNDVIYALTNQQLVSLRIDLESFEGEKRFAEYSSFRIDNQDGRYQLHLGDYSGSAADSLGRSKGMNFSTYDSDNDLWTGHCAQRFQGGWWFNSCHDANLNGRYHKGHHESYADGINWYHWKGFHYSLKFSEMKIRPVPFVHPTQTE